MKNEWKDLLTPTERAAGYRPTRELDDIVGFGLRANVGDAWEYLEVCFHCATDSEIAEHSAGLTREECLEHDWTCCRCGVPLADLLVKG